jgi:hypothetical protein
MIITRLYNGLGNQLFQYALARRLSLLHNVPLKLDASQIEIYKIRKYSLRAFNIIEDFATEDDIVKIKGRRSISFRRLAEKILPYYKRSYIEEQFFHFDPNIIMSPKNVYLKGYWQSERYFKDIEDIIRQEFTIKPEPDAINSQIAKIITDANSVSIHVRRGDYVNDNYINKIYCTCSLDYYHEAVETITKRTPHPQFFVFSDNPVWVKKNLIINYKTTYVTHNNAEKDYEDLRLMSLCRHNIIANSSFSWWGAWLNRFPEKIIIAPKRWFTSVVNNDTNDLIPSSWVRL